MESKIAPQVALLGPPSAICLRECSLWWTVETWGFGSPRIRNQPPHKPLLRAVSLPHRDKMALDMCGAYADMPKLDESADLWNGPAITYNAASDTYTDTNNCTFRQLFQDYPVLKPLYPFQWENEFNAWALGNFAERYMHVAFLIAAGYLAFLVLGQKFMAGREKFQLRGFMQLWNLLLSVFSFFGFIRTAPHLLHSITTRGFYFSVR